MKDLNMQIFRVFKSLFLVRMTINITKGVFSLFKEPAKQIMEGKYVTRGVLTGI